MVHLLSLQTCLLCRFIIWHGPAHLEVAHAIGHIDTSVKQKSYECVFCFEYAAHKFEYVLQLPFWRCAQQIIQWDCLQPAYNRNCRLPTKHLKRAQQVATAVSCSAFRPLYHSLHSTLTLLQPNQSRMCWQIRVSLISTATQLGLRRKNLKPLSDSSSPCFMTWRQRRSTQSNFIRHAGLHRLS